MENPVSYAKHHKYIMGILVFAVIATTAVGSRLVNKKTLTQTGEEMTKVTLVEARTFLNDKETVAGSGTVESLQQADLRSQASGPVTSIKAQIGQKVGAGQQLVTLQNNDIAASLAQVQAVLRSQQARLDEIKSGARSEQIQLAESSVNAAKQALADTTAAQDAIVNNAYSAFLNSSLAILPGKDNVSKAKLTLGGSYNLNQTGVYTITIEQGGEKPPFNVSGLEKANGWITRGSAVNIGSGGLFFTVSTDGDIFPGESWTITIPNPQSPFYAQTKNAYETAKKVRDAAVSGATSALQTAERAYELTVAGATSDQVKAQEALVEQAAANVQAVAAQLEKTIIRSPISGVVASLPVKYGELVSPGSLVASVVSSGGLQVKAFLSDSDAPFVVEGADVTINENIKGKVSQISPSIDPLTKNIELRILVADSKQSGLVVGQNVNIKIAAKQKLSGKTFLLPLQAVKISSGGASVFTIKEDSVLEERTVRLGSVFGEYVEVTEGLNPEMKIVTTVYELKNGQKVSVD